MARKKEINIFLKNFEKDILGAKTQSRITLGRTAFGVAVFIALLFL